MQPGVRRSVHVVVAALAALVGACSSDKPTPPASRDDAAARATIVKVDAVADDLATGAAGAAPTEACRTAAVELDRVGSPEKLATVSADLSTPELQEAALDQQAAISSVMAACRGDAPVSVAEAAAELAEANRIMETLLARQ